MAPPLLPNTRLAICPACAEHVKRSEAACPHCGAALAETRASGAAAVVMMGLALAGCPDKGPDTTSASAGESETMLTTEGDDTTEGTDSTGATSVATAESDYGTATITGLETTQATDGTTDESATGTGTTSATDPTASTTNAESDYGTAAL